MTSTTTIEIEAVGELVELVNVNTVSYRFEQADTPEPLIMMVHLSQPLSVNGHTTHPATKIKLIIEKMITTPSGH